MPSGEAEPLYLLDTNVLVHGARRGYVHERIQKRFGLFALLRRPLVSIVSEAELISFAVQNAWGEAKQDQLRFILSSFDRADISIPGMLNAYVSIDVFSSAQGVNMGKNDLWIAATANALGAVLLTTDRDFDHLPSNLPNRIWIDPTL